MFIRRKLVRGKDYYALVENYRANGHVKQRIVLSLGRHPNIEKALDWERFMLGVYQKAATMKKGGFVHHSTMREDKRRPGCSLRSFALAGESSRLKAIESEAKIALLERYRDVVTQIVVRHENCSTTDCSDTKVSAPHET